jgi:hypothetical protein
VGTIGERKRERLLTLNIDYNKTWLSIESKYRPEKNTFPFVTVCPCYRTWSGVPTYKPTGAKVTLEAQPHSLEEGDPRLPPLQRLIV